MPEEFTYWLEIPLKVRYSKHKEESLFGHPAYLGVDLEEIKPPDLKELIKKETSQILIAAYEDMKGGN